ncbi:MAG: hypothetical protein AVDCRST_MAG01-01-4365, partial [uncultured Rubrobacteraceae bacterium]
CRKFVACGNPWKSVALPYKEEVAGSSPASPTSRSGLD